MMVFNRKAFAKYFQIVVVFLFVVDRIYSIFIIFHMKQYGIDFTDSKET